MTVGQDAQAPEGIFPQLGPDVGFRLPQYVVLERLTAAYRIVRRNPEAVRNALIRQGQRFVEDQVYALVARRNMPLYTGYPLEEAQLPGIGVSIMSSAEDVGRQIIGEVGIHRQGDSIVKIYGTWMRTTVQLAHYGFSQVEVDVLGQLTTFLLLARRDKMEMEDGLMEQAVILNDINPNTNFKPENAFMRMVQFSCAHIDTWGVAQSPLIASVDVTLEGILDGDIE